MIYSGWFELGLLKIALGPSLPWEGVLQKSKIFSRRFDQIRDDVTAEPPNLAE